MWWQLMAQNLCAIDQSNLQLIADRKPECHETEDLNKNALNFKTRGHFVSPSVFRLS